MIIDLSLLKDNFQQFYGFNGSNAIFNPNFEKHNNDQFISHKYYAVRKISKTLNIDVHGKLPVNNIEWDLGLGYYNIHFLNFKNIQEQLNNRLTLFQKYIEFGVIPSSIKNGGVTKFFKCALIYDTRDDGSIPTKGIWMEGLFLKAPVFLNNSFSYSQITIIHRQYLTLINNLIFAYRIAFQNKLSGQMPFYMMSYIQSTYQVQEGLGGVKTLRGILNERLVGKGYLFGNIELRKIAFQNTILDRNVALAFNVFTDWGKIINKYSISKNSDFKSIDYKAGLDNVHYSVGAGIRLIINHNFILSLDYGKALSRSDGDSGLYLDSGFLF